MIQGVKNQRMEELEEKNSLLNNQEEKMVKMQKEREANEAFLPKKCSKHCVDSTQTWKIQL